MNEQYLQYFVVSAEEGTITRAAERLGVSQPALSQQLKRLETALDAVLLERTPRGVRLTSSGQAFLPYAQRVLRELREARTVLNELNGLKRGLLTVGIVQTVNINLMPVVVADFNRRYSGVALNVLEYASDQIEPNLVSGKLDVGIGFLWDDQPDLVTEPLFEEDLMLVVPIGHPLSNRNVVEVRELDGMNMVNALPGSKRIWNACCDEAGITTKVVAEMSSIASVIVSVHYMNAATVVPAMALVGAPPAHVRSIPLVNPKPRRVVGCMWRQQQYRSTLSNVLTEMIRGAVGTLANPLIRRRPA